MSFKIEIQGLVAEADAEVHAWLHKIAEEATERVRQLEGAKIERAGVVTPTATVDLAPPPATEANPAAVVTGAEPVAVHERPAVGSGDQPPPGGK